MSGEIEVSETPNWLQELEAKRERRLKARLGHETGAGAPCLKCEDKCPGLDLHFWRKCCKICKCSKEEHEVQDDDIYGWAQFQLLGSKPNKIKRKIVLPGKKDEMELDWTPKGHNDTVDKYLKTLPPEQLPVKGSQAAQDRKQLLQKQIPIHDIDPTLCHELSNDELKQMNDYISHVKQTSVGVGQIVSLSNIIKAHLHMLNPSEAALIASRYPKGIPLSEIVKLQSQSRANALKQQGLSEKLDKLNLQDPSNKNLPNFNANTVNTTEENLNPQYSNNFRDISYPGYMKDMNQVPTNAQFSAGLKGLNKNFLMGNHQDQNVPQTLDEKFLQNPNFDPKNIPSQFLQQSGHHGQPYPYRPDQQNENLEYTPGNDPANNAFAPYNKSTSNYRPGERNLDGSPLRNANYASDIQGRGAKSPSGYRPGEVPNQNTSRFPGGPDESFAEDFNPLQPNFAKKLAKYPSGQKNATDDNVENFGTPAGSNPVHYENVEEMRKNNVPGLPNYIPGKYNVVSEVQSPSKLPKNVKDLAFSTYNPSDPNSGTNDQQNTFAPPNLAYENYPPGYFDQTSPYKQGTNQYGNDQFGIPTDKHPNQNIMGLTPDQYAGLKNDLSNIFRPIPSDDTNNQGTGNVPFGKNSPQNQNSSSLRPGQYARPGSSPSKTLGSVPSNLYDENVPYDQSYPGSQGTNTPYDQNSSGLRPGQYGRPPGSPSKTRGNLHDENVPYDQSYSGMPGTNAPFDTNNPPSDQNSSGLRPGLYARPINSPSKTLGNLQNQNVPYSGTSGANTPYDQNSSGLRPGQYGRPGSSPSKTLSNVHDPNVPYDQSYPGLQDPNAPFDDKNLPYNQNSSGLRPGQYAGPNTSPSKTLDSVPGQNVPLEQYDPTNAPYLGGTGSNLPYNAKPTKKLSELHPGKINVDEDFLHPSQVTIGAIQDINYPEIKAATQGTNDFYEDYSPDSLREILNNVKLPDCHYCKKPFEENEFAITIDRANVLFHAQCFKCAGCNQILADNVYFYNKETDNVYCGRDYAKVRGFPRCKACDELIFTKEYCLAENSTFHLKHFCCIECDKPLAGQDYTLEDEMPYCLPCFEHSKASKCSACGRVIKPDEIGCNLNSVHFHAVDECFACKVCKKPLMGKKLLLRNEKLYCSHDCFGTDKK